jgi:integrase
LAARERIAKLYRDLESGKITGQPLTGGTAERYVAALKDIMRRALQVGAIPINPFSLLDDDDRPSDTGRVRDHYQWSPGEISALITAATKRAVEKIARYDYAPLIHLLVLVGLRIGEAQGLRVQDVDLLGGELHVEHSWKRPAKQRKSKSKLGSPKTEASRRVVPLSPGLVDMLARLIPADADPEDFVFHAKDNPRKPISYWNFRRRGFLPALEDAGLAGKEITIHSLRSAAISMYAASGLSMLETATVMGQKDPQVTWKHYARLFDRTKVNERIRAAQESIEL